MGIYNGLYTVSPNILPPQSVPLKEKLAKGTDTEKSWSEKCMDALETIGKSQYNSNLKLIENYEMVKGRFIFNHYFHTEGYQSTLNQLTADFEMPSYLRHYDIISQVINTMSGEWQKKPDIFKVRQLGDAATNEYLRTKIDLTREYVFSKINTEIDKKLVAQGIDINKQDFASEEEQSQYQEQISQLKQKMTPIEIQNYMDTDFLTVAEIWGQHQKEFDREYFNLPEKEKIEFEDMLVADRCFRHFYLTSTGYMQETWNPVNVFFQKSPDTVNIEDGDYVGRVFSLSISTIIDRYGYLLSKKDLDQINGYYKENSKDWADKEYNWVYDNYLMPFKDYPTYDLMKDSWNKNASGSPIEQVGSEFFNSLNNDSSPSREREGYYFVTEGYWKSQKKLFKITYLDTELNEIVVKIVDENYVIPKEFKESKNVFDDTHDLNTYCETSINEVWKGVKINTGVDKKLERDLYIKVQPNDFQFKGDLNLYGCKLPVCGQVFSVRNSQSMSLVDMMKPYQIGFNVSMNQMYQLMEKEIGMFVVMDVNMFPNSKDWGGEDSWDKWMLIAKQYGLLPADTSPQNLKGSLAGSGGFLPKVLDLNLAGQMVSRQNLAMFFKNMALEQVGFNQYRTGNFAASTTATGIEQGSAKSYSQTESHFTNFSNYLRRCLQMSLNIAQFVQSQKDNITIKYTKSDFSKGFIKILGTDLLLPDLGVFISNSQENARQLEMIRQYALQNNTSGLSPVDVSNVIMMNSPNEIRNQLKISYDKLMQNQQQSQQLQQQALEQEKQIKQSELDLKNQHFEELMENNLDVERIRAGAAIIGNEKPEVEPVDTTNADNLKLEQHSDSQNLKQQKLSLDKEQLRINNEYNSKKLALDQAKINASIQIQNKETESTKIMKGKDMP